MVLGHIPRGHVLVRIQEENLGLLEVPKERCKGDDGWMRGVSWDQNSARNYLIGVSGEESTLPMQGMLVPSLSGHLRYLVEQKNMKRFFGCFSDLDNNQTGRVRKFAFFFLLLFSHSVMCDSLPPHRLQHARLTCPYAFNIHKLE